VSIKTLGLQAQHCDIGMTVSNPLPITNYSRVIYNNVNSSPENPFSAQSTYTFRILYSIIFILNNKSCAKKIDISTITYLSFCSQTSYFGREYEKPGSSQDRQSHIFDPFDRIYIVFYSPKLCTHHFRIKPYKTVRTLLDQYFDNPTRKPFQMQFRCVIYKRVRYLPSYCIYYSDSPSNLTLYHLT